VEKSLWIIIGVYGLIVSGIISLIAFYVLERSKFREVAFVVLLTATLLALTFFLEYVLQDTEFRRFMGQRSFGRICFLLAFLILFFSFLIFYILFSVIKKSGKLVKKKLTKKVNQQRKFTKRNKS